MIFFENVKAGFDGKIIFNHFTFSLPDEGCFALMGPSGSGKTTFLRLLAGTLSPMEGKVIWQPERKKAFLFQEDRLLEWENALKNVSLSSGEACARACLAKMEIEDVYQYPAEMSGGMRRRVAIARALAFDGEVLLMDEPFKGLDEALKMRVAHVLRENAKLIILTTHDVQEAKMMGAEILHIDDMIVR